jgi:hypothetical protein
METLKQFEWRNDNVERGYEFAFKETDRWCNARSDLDIFGKYVDFVDPLVRKVHGVLFPATNKRVNHLLEDPKLN